WAHSLLCFEDARSASPAGTGACNYTKNYTIPGDFGQGDPAPYED
ncbi:hypothetical protein SAMN02745216_05020, partial [Desulfatibacillum alkenivorans DSM 16219]